jgi:hypothetical protein
MKKHLRLALTLLGIALVLAVLAAYAFSDRSIRRLEGEQEQVSEEQFARGLVSVQAEAALYRVENDTYEGFCDSSYTRDLLEDLSSSQKDVTSRTPSCHDSSSGWAVSLPFGADTFYCSDGQSKNVMKTQTELAGISCMPAAEKPQADAADEKSALSLEGTYVRTRADGSESGAITLVSVADPSHVYVIALAADGTSNAYGSLEQELPLDHNKATYIGPKNEAGQSCEVTFVFSKDKTVEVAVENLAVCGSEPLLWGVNVDPTGTYTLSASG